jgi:uncharacterized protein YndB with AHSA1/START domain
MVTNISTIVLNAPIEKVWNALTQPDLVKQWQYGSDLITDWIVGKEIRFRNEWEGQVFEQWGTVLEVVPNQKITRTFEMENSNFAVQLEFLEFEKLTDETSKLIMHIVFKSIELRNQLLKLPFAMGINMAHDRLQEVVNKLK